MGLGGARGVMRPGPDHCSGRGKAESATDPIVEARAMERSVHAGNGEVCTSSGGTRTLDANYDRIGKEYTRLRKPDPRIAAVIDRALGSSRHVLNVGAGAGAYEPSNRRVTAVEPSLEMIRQRTAHGAMVVQACAEALPFPNRSFDASMAILTIHHWADPEKGLHEMRRVTRGPVVLLTFDPAHRPWLTEYFPDLVSLDEAQMPPMADYERWLGPVRITPVLIPHDCRDGFLYAYWRRPWAHLDARVRAGSSSFSRIPDIQGGLQKLKADLDSGNWERRYPELTSLDVYDAGYRLVVTKETEPESGC